MQIKRIETQTTTGVEVKHGIYNASGVLIATTDTMDRAFAFVADIDGALRAERLRHIQNINAILSGEQVADSLS